MLTSRLITEDDVAKTVHKVAPRTGTESSRVLLGLLNLARKADPSEPPRAADADRAADPLSGIIARPVLRSLMAAMQYRNGPIVLHGRRTARLAVTLASHLGWERPQLTILELSALLHDLGKIGVPDNILGKPGRLSGDEAELLAVHHNIALDVLAACRVHADVLTTITEAYPHYDASDDVPRRAADMTLGARILAVADAYDAMRSEQPYRPGMSHDEALEAFTSARDGRFDPAVVAALTRLSEKSGPNGTAALNPHPADAELAPLGPAEAHEAAAVGQIFSYIYILESLYDGFSLVDADLRYVLVSRGAAGLLGRPAAELMGRTWTSRTLPMTEPDGTPVEDHELPITRVLSDGKAVTQAVCVRTPDGRSVQVELQATPLLDDAGRVLGIAEIYRNQTRAGAKPREVRELKLAASRDPLTGLSNRGDLEARLSEHVKRFSAGGPPFAVLFLDVDFFKPVNDNYGHAVGDQVLVGLAKLLQQECYSGELIARYGGEEFVVVCPETDLAAARRRAERLRLAISQNVLCANPDVKVTASFGAAAAEKGDKVESLLRRADRALYRAKEGGRNRTCTFTAAELDRPAAAEKPVEPPVASDPFVFEATFKACLASDMAVFKLGGFLRDEHAILSDVGPGRAVMRIGRPSLLGGWGRTGKTQPVECRLEFGDGSGRADAGKAIPVRVVIRPAVRIRNAEAFRARACQVLNRLRSYFAGE